MNDRLITYLTNGGLLKTLGIVVLFLFTLGSGAIVAYDILSNQPVNPVVATFLSMVLTHVTNMMFQAQLGGIVTSALLINPQQGQQGGSEHAS